ncbi:hypothetical protein F5879DRAFT_639471 [Lentinula edodes]|nr:hypothetical protein F5879DRAFT_639471 [Lentinula edodes]
MWKLKSSKVYCAPQESTSLLCKLTLLWPVKAVNRVQPPQKPSSWLICYAFWDSIQYMFTKTWPSYNMHSNGARFEVLGPIVLVGAGTMLCSSVHIRGYSDSVGVCATLICLPGSALLASIASFRSRSSIVGPMSPKNIK